MSDIQRYNISISYNHSSPFLDESESDDGEWCSFYDVEELEARVKRLEDAILHDIRAEPFHPHWAIINETPSQSLAKLREGDNNG